MHQHGTTSSLSNRAIADALDANRAVFEALLRPMPVAIRTWRPRPDHWCLLEVACHLLDEEREDFRARLRSVLDDPASPLPPIDPQSWVTARRYMEQDYGATLDAFLAERAASVSWLRSITEPGTGEPDASGVEPARWANAFQHPRFGPMSARLFLANWLAHDRLHLRQIVKIQFLHLQAHAGVTLEYAGTW